MCDLSGGGVCEREREQGRKKERKEGRKKGRQASGGKKSGVVVCGILQL